jgi:hypothetical protein
VQDTSGLGAEVGVSNEDPGPVCQGLSASSRSQRHTVDEETLSVIPRAVSSAASSGQDQRDSGMPVSAVN